MNDEDGYRRYFAEGGKAPVEPHGGRILGYDPQPETIEGEGWWGPARAVLVEFETEAGFRAWYESPEYQRALGHRLTATDSNAILLRQKPVRV